MPLNSKIEVYFWQAGNQVPCPTWVSQLIVDRQLRQDGDGDWFFLDERTGNQTRIGADDVLISDEKGTVGVMRRELYETMVRKPGEVPPGMHAFTDANGPEPTREPNETDDPRLTPREAVDTFPPPPYSSAVLARSANARARQAEYDRLAKAGVTANPNNAALEGAHAQPEADEPPTGATYPG